MAANAVAASVVFQSVFHPRPVLPCCPPQDAVRRYHAQYQEAAWGPALAALRADAAAGPASASAALDRAGKEAVKERWAAVNRALEAAQAQQVFWTVPDAALRRSLREAVAAAVVAPYEVRREGGKWAPAWISPSMPSLDATREGIRVASSRPSSACSQSRCL